jgi:hypothetical protein
VFTIIVGYKNDTMSAISNMPVNKTEPMWAQFEYVHQ